MEIPCKLTFMTANETEYMKTRKLVNDALSVELSSESMYNVSIVKKTKIRLLTISG